MPDAGQYLKAGVVGSIAGALPFALFGLVSGNAFSKTSDPSGDLLYLLMCVGAGIAAAILILIAYERAILRSQRRGERDLDA